MSKLTPRYIVTQMKPDPTVAKRYQRAGWIAFDTTHTADKHGRVEHGPLRASRAEAVADCIRLNNKTDEAKW